MSPGVATAWRGAGAEFPERVQLGRARLAEQAVPNRRSEPDDAGQSAFEVTKPDGAQQRGEIGAQRAHRGFGFWAGVDGDHQKDRGAGQLQREQLGQRARSRRRSGRVHRLDFIGRSPARGAIAPVENALFSFVDHAINGWRAQLAAHYRGRFELGFSDAPRGSRARMMASGGCCQMHPTAAKPASSMVRSCWSRPPIRSNRS